MPAAVTVAAALLRQVFPVTSRATDLTAARESLSTHLAIHWESLINSTNPSTLNDTPAKRVSRLVAMTCLAFRMDEEAESSDEACGIAERVDRDHCKPYGLEGMEFELLPQHVHNTLLQPNATPDVQRGITP